MDDGAREAEWFAGRLRELREAAGFAQEQLAGRAGMSRDGIAHLETGRRAPSWEAVLAICRALGVSTEAFRRPPTTEPRKGPGRPPKAKLAEPAPEAEGKPARKRQGE